MTDHSNDIRQLRTLAAEFHAKARGARTARSRTDNNSAGNMCLAAAELLQCHDDTGISLDHWEGVRDFVEDMIDHPITENGV